MRSAAAAARAASGSAMPAMVTSSKVSRTPKWRWAMPPAPTKPTLSMGMAILLRKGAAAHDRAVERRGLGGHALGGEGLFVASPPGLARRRRAGAASAAARASARSSASPGSARKGWSAPSASTALVDPGRDDRQAERHRLEHHERQALEARGEREEVGGGHQVADVVAVAEEGDGGAALRLGLAGGALGALADEEQTGAQAAGVKRAHGPDQGALVLLGGEAADAEEERRVLRDAERRAGLGAGADDGRRLDAVPDRDEPGAGAEAGERRRPGRRRRLRDRDEGVDGRGGRGVVRLLGGIGDEPRQVLGPHDAHARGGAGARQGRGPPSRCRRGRAGGRGARRRGGRPRRVKVTASRPAAPARAAKPAAASGKASVTRCVAREARGRASACAGRGPRARRCRWRAGRAAAQPWAAAAGAATAASRR